jgi:hypothetical protein
MNRVSHPDELKSICTIWIYTDWRQVNCNQIEQWRRMGLGIDPFE